MAKLKRGHKEMQIASLGTLLTTWKKNKKKRKLGTKLKSPFNINSFVENLNTSH